jgi:hypothetical protein
MLRATVRDGSAKPQEMGIQEAELNHHAEGRVNPTVHVSPLTLFE